jgi:hypothetical protein
MRRALTPAVGMIIAATVSVSLLGCGGGSRAAAPAASTTTAPDTTTTIPQALWLGQARDWLAAHGSDLTAISTSAQNLGQAAKAGNGQLTEIAITQFQTAVGKADGDLPANAFGQELHSIFVDYITALATINKGLRNNDQATYKAGSDQLAAAVTKFATISTRLKETP